MFDKAAVSFRILKSKITGKVPCSFESKHGHDFEHVEDNEDILECSVCKLKAYYCPLQGGFCEL